MHRPEWLDNALEHLIDGIFALTPQPLPSQKQLKRCKIISHRGERDNKTIFENTVLAFDKVVNKGVWGIEFDVRFTKDLVPIVFHDTDCRRLFKSKLKINETTFEVLRKAHPQIPSLEEIIQRFGKKLHLMIELKEEHYPAPQKQARILENLLKALEPKKDYHIISLHTPMFNVIHFVSLETFLPVAILNTKALSEEALQKHYGGITAYYPAMRKARVKQHLSAGQRVGVGFITSKNALCYALRRDIEWIFTNYAVKLQLVYDRLLSADMLK